MYQVVSLWSRAIDMDDSALLHKAMHVQYAMFCNENSQLVCVPGERKEKQRDARRDGNMCWLKSVHKYICLFTCIRQPFLE